MKKYTGTPQSPASGDGNGPSSRPFFLIRLFRAIGRFLAAVFGRFRVSYQPPAWVSKGKTGAALAARMVKTGVLDRITGFVKKKPVLFWSVLGGTVVIAIGLAVGLNVLANLPHPSYLSITMYGLNAPGPDDDETVPQPFTLSFNGSAARIDLAGKTLTRGVSLEPFLPGAWKWKSDRALEFTPTQALPIGQEYTVRMDKDIFSETALLEQYEYRFRTADFDCSISASSFYIDPVNPSSKHVLLSLTFTHRVNVKEFENALSLKPVGAPFLPSNIPDRPYKFTITYGKNQRSAHLISENIPIPVDPIDMEYTVRNTFHASRGGRPPADARSRRIRVPGVFDYSGVSFDLRIVPNAFYEMDQVLFVSTEGRAKSEDILKNLNVYMLPKDQVNPVNNKVNKDHQWNLIEIDRRILEQSTRISPESIPREDEYSELAPHKVMVSPGRYLFVQLRHNTPFWGGYRLKNDSVAVLRVPSFPKMVRILNEGALLSLSGEKKLSMAAYGVKSVVCEVGRLIPDQINHLVSQASGDIKHPYFHDYQFGVSNVATRASEIIQLNEAEPGKPQFFSFDFSKYLGRGDDPRVRNGLFFMRVRENTGRPDPRPEFTRPRYSYYDDYGDEYGYDDEYSQAPASTTSDQRFILVTDLGFIVKRLTDRTSEVYVQSVATGRPVAGAAVEVLGKNGLPVFTTATDETGRAAIKNVDHYGAEREPVAFVVKSGEDLSFMSFSAADRQINWSRFDTGGTFGSSETGRLDAYLFTDRGLYRPGETVSLGLIVKTRSFDAALPPLPLSAVLFDPRGAEIAERPLLLSPNGFLELTFPTADTALTGSYKVDVYEISQDALHKRQSLLGSTDFKVEEFRPDTMNVSCRLPNPEGLAWLNPDQVTAEVTLKNLFGTPARGNALEAGISLSPFTPRFSRYPGYIFHDPFRTTKQYDSYLEDNATDDEGRASYKIDLSSYERASYRLTFVVNAREAQGGRTVSATASAVVSPLSTLLGYKPDGDLGYVSQNGARAVDFIAVNPRLETAALSKLICVINELRYVSILTRQENDTYAYKSVLRKVQRSRLPLTIPKTGFRLDLPTRDPGNFEVIVQDADEKEICTFPFSVVGRVNLNRELEKNAELDVKLNQADFTAGEEIQVFINAPYTGAGLITIEQDKVYAYKWFTSATTASIQTIRVPETLEGNGYVCVSFVRDLQSREIYMSPLSYAAVPFTVSREKRTNRITLNAPSEVKSGRTLIISYSTARPGGIILFGVDEGILQAARYTTPDPLAHFFRKRALEVKSAQILDLILPEFSLQRTVSAMGGGDGEMAALEHNQNPFKRKQQQPVVFWSGILAADQTPRQYTYVVPDTFNGTLRIMAVAVGADTVGGAEKRVLAGNDFIITPNIPLFAVPGDEIIAAVNVVNNVKGSRSLDGIEVRLQLDDHLTALEAAPARLTLKEGYDQTVFFRLRANDKPGGASVKVTASRGAVSSSVVSTLSIRPHTTHRVSLATGLVDSGTKDIPVARDLYQEFAVRRAAVSFLPVGAVRGLDLYLESYPYLCTEQLVSQAFLPLSLSDFPEGYPPAKAREAHDKIVNILAYRQNDAGAFGLYAANQYVSDYFTVYAMHYLTEARERGFPVPEFLMHRGLGYLEHELTGRNDSLSALRDNLYAIYVLTRNHVITTKYINAVRDECDRARGFYQDPAALFLAASYSLLKQTAEADKVYSRVSLAAPVAGTNDSFNLMGYESLTLYMTALHFPSRLSGVARQSLERIIAEIDANRFNTYSAGLAAMAVSAYSRTAGAPGAGTVTISEVYADGTAKALTLPGGRFPVFDISPRAAALHIANPAGLRLFYNVTVSGFDRKLPALPVKHGLELYKEMAGLTAGEFQGNPMQAGSNAASARLGDEVETVIKLRSQQGSLENIAVVDLIPSGFEVNPDSVREAASRGNGSDLPVDYVDVREDRVIIYCRVTADLRQFRYRLRAVTKGVSIVPPVQAEGMYDRSLWALSGLSAVRVTD